MAERSRVEHTARQRELAWRRGRIAAALNAMQATLEPASLVHRATRRLQWRDLRAASTVVGRTLCENPIATLTAAGSLAWLAIRSRAVVHDQSFRADLVLVPDRENGDPSANFTRCAAIASPESRRIRAEKTPASRSRFQRAAGRTSWPGPGEKSGKTTSPSLLRVWRSTRF